MAYRVEIARNAEAELEDRFPAFLVRDQASQHVQIDRLVNQDVHTLAEGYQVVAGTRVARECHRAPGVINPVSKRRLEASVGHEKCGDRHAVSFIDLPLADVVRDHPDAFGGEALVHVPAHMNVEGERVLEVTHHVARAVRAPDFEWHLPFWRGGPRREYQVGHVDDVVRMQVRQEQLRYGVHRKARLHQTLHEAASRIEQKAFAARLDEGADHYFNVRK